MFSPCGNRIQLWLRYILDALQDPVSQSWTQKLNKKNIFKYKEQLWITSASAWSFHQPGSWVSWACVTQMSTPPTLYITGSAASANLISMEILS